MANFDFRATGTFAIDAHLPMVCSCTREIEGFELPEGRTIRLCIALEVEDADGTTTVITKEAAMDAVGFRHLDYIDLSFKKEEPTHG